MFSIAVHYLAVFVIALIVGQVGNVIANRNASRVEFERLLVTFLSISYNNKRINLKKKFSKIGWSQTVYEKSQCSC